MATKLEDRDWELLLGRIKDGKCTPIIGEDVHSETVPHYIKTARKWADESNYPIVGAEEDLTRVSQFLSVYRDPMYPKEELIKEIKPIKPPDFSLPDEPHAVLADLPLPIYLTTNFNGYMEMALKSRNKDSKRDFCRWNETVKHHTSVFDGISIYEPTPANPVVFHLYGYDKSAESLVLTEDDYLDFLVNISKDESIVPPRIQRAIASTSLMIVGYTLGDWSFKVLFRGLISSRQSRMNRISVTVQLPPVSEDANDPKQQRLQKYFDDYFGGAGIRAYWGTTKEFTTELRQRWRDFTDAN